MKVDIKFKLTEQQALSVIQDWAQDNIVRGLVLDSIDMFSYELRCTGHIGEDDHHKAETQNDDQEGAPV